MSTGKIILDQLRTLGMHDLMCWGARGFTSFDDRYFQGKDKTWHLGGLFFQVSGLLHKQKVMIRLQGNDLYHIEIGNIVKGQWIKRKGSESKTDIYFDMLTDIIDCMVEGTKDKTPEEAREIYDNANVSYL